MLGPRRARSNRKRSFSGEFFPALAARQPAPQRSVRRHHATRRELRLDRDRDDRERRQHHQCYLHDDLACLRAVNESTGRVLDYLEKEGRAGNPIVVYAADQGFYLGEHGWFDKRGIFEESRRAPLLVRWPGVVQPGSVNRDLVANVDFAETLLDAAGIPVPADMQGRSFRSLLKGRSPADWRKSFYYQYYEYPAPHHVRPHYGVVTDRYKLVRFYGTGEDYAELFDLRNDPLELRSVYDDPAYAPVQAERAKELARRRPGWSRWRSSAARLARRRRSRCINCAGGRMTPVCGGLRPDFSHHPSAFRSNR